jgi:hypothetical protein
VLRLPVSLVCPRSKSSLHGLILFLLFLLNYFRLSPPSTLTTLSLRELLYNWRFTANQFVLGTSPLSITTSKFIFQVSACGYSPYVTSSLTRGWVCRLQLLLDPASAVILRFESRGTDGHILLSQTRDSPNLEGQVPVFISPRNRLAQLYPQALDLLFVASYDSQDYSGGIRPRRFVTISPSLQKCLPRRCTETVVLLLLRACTFPREPVFRRCLAMNYFGFQASCHNIFLY